MGKYRNSCIGNVGNSTCKRLPDLILTSHIIDTVSGYTLTQTPNTANKTDKVKSIFVQV